MDRKELVKTLELVQPGLADNNLVEVFTCFMFGKGTISAYNDEIGVVAKAPYDDEAFAVSGRTFLDLMKNSGGDDVEISIEDEVAIIVGKSNFRLPFFRESDWLFTEPAKEKWLAEATISETLLQGVKVCLTTASRDHTSPALMGICFNLESDGIFSCDGDAVTCIAGGGSLKGKGVYVVPNAFCDTVLKICEETKTVKGRILLNEGWAKAVLGDFTIYGRVIAQKDKPLDHAALIKKTLHANGEVVEYVDLPEGLSEALSRARVLADPESAKTSLVVKGNKLKMVTQSRMGIVEDELGLKGHPAVEAHVHASLVQRSIGVCTRFSIRENCTAYRLDDRILQVVSNIGE